jgi:metal-dependent amidase/aminoacylase/carboxypeptidase family protein
MASTDCGNVSQVVPTVHACIKLETEGEKKFGPHTKEFAEATCSKEGMKVMLHSARAVAISVLELAHDLELQKQVKAEFVDNKKYF